MRATGDGAGLNRSRQIVLGRDMCRARSRLRTHGGRRWCASPAFCWRWRLLRRRRAQAAKEGRRRPRSAPGGLKVLRYVSLKADRVQLRQGPGTDYPVAWVVPARRAARRGDPRIRRLAPGARRRRHGRLGAQQPAERPAHRARPAVGGQGGPGPGPARRRCASDDRDERPRRGAGGGRRARQHHRLRDGWCRVSIGELSAATSSRPSSGAPTPTSDQVGRAGPISPTSRTTTSMCAILRWSGGSGRPSTRMVSPGMSSSVAVGLDEVVVVVRGVGVEVGALAADRDLAQQARPA